MDYTLKISRRVRIEAAARNLVTRLQCAVIRLKEEHGQDLVEYALVVALVAFGATAGMRTLGSGINTSFTNISSVLASSLT